MCSPVLRSAPRERLRRSASSPSATFMAISRHGWTLRAQPALPTGRAIGPAGRRRSFSLATSPIAARTRSKIVRSLQQLQAEAPQAGGRVIVVLGNHEAMNLLGDNRYTTAGEYAAFVDDKSVARRERLYMTMRKQLEAANPKALPSQVREQWLTRTPLGWVEHKLAWSPSGELGRWATGNPAVVKVGDYPVRPRRPQRRICKAASRCAEPRCGIGDGFGR